MAFPGIELNGVTPEEPGVKLTLLRPATVYVALSKAPNEACALQLHAGSSFAANRTGQA